MSQKVVKYILGVLVFGLVVSCGTLSLRGDVLRIGVEQQGEFPGTATPFKSDAEERLVQWYKLPLTANQRVFVRIFSEFDNYLVIRNAAGELTENDDFNGTDAGILYMATARETIEIGVSSFSQEDTGAFRLLVSELSTPSSIQAGEPITARLEEQNEFAGLIAKEYVLNLAKRSRVTVNLTSVDYDAYLIVTDAEGSSYHDDDGGEDANARLSGFFPAGPLYILVTSLDRESVGGFELTAALLPEPQSIGLGETTAILPGNHPGNAYSVQIQRNHRYSVDLRSAAFDAFVEVYLPDGTILIDDDGGNGTDSKLIFRNKADGVMTIIAMDLLQGSGGSYSLAIRDLGEAQLIAYQANRQLNDKDSFITTMDATAAERDGRYIHTYRLRVPRDQRAVVQHNSTDFDAYLIAQDASGAVFEDDDGGSGTDAMLRLAGGTEYTLEFTGFEAGLVGDYEVIVNFAPMPKTILERSGVLGESSRRDISGKLYSEYTFTAEAGRDVEIELRSDNFDAYLYLHDSGGKAVAEDDDGLASGTDALIVHRIEQAGTYKVIVTSVSADATGAYRLIVRQ